MLIHYILMKDRALASVNSCSQRKLDNFLQAVSVAVRFRADDSLCEFLKKPVCKNLT
jgi:hypothetical protein